MLSSSSDEEKDAQSDEEVSKISSAKKSSTPSGKPTPKSAALKRKLSTSSRKSNPISRVRRKSTSKKSNQASRGCEMSTTSLKKSNPVSSFKRNSSVSSVESLPGSRHSRKSSVSSIRSKSASRSSRKSSISSVESNHSSKHSRNSSTSSKNSNPVVSGSRRTSSVSSIDSNPRSGQNRKSSNSSRQSNSASRSSRKSSASPLGSNSTSRRSRKSSTTSKKSNLSSRSSRKSSVSSIESRPCSRHSRKSSPSPRMLKSVSRSNSKSSVSSVESQPLSRRSRKSSSSSLESHPVSRTSVSTSPSEIGEEKTSSSANKISGTNQRIENSKNENKPSGSINKIIKEKDFSPENVDKSCKSSDGKISKPEKLNEEYNNSQNECTTSTTKKSLHTTLEKACEKDTLYKQRKVFPSKGSLKEVYTSTISDENFNLSKEKTLSENMKQNLIDTLSRLSRLPLTDKLFQKSYVKLYRLSNLQLSSFLSAKKLPSGKVPTKKSNVKGQKDTQASFKTKAVKGSDLKSQEIPKKNQISSKSLVNDSHSLSKPKKSTSMSYKSKEVILSSSEDKDDEKQKLPLKKLQNMSNKTSSSSSDSDTEPLKQKNISKVIKQTTKNTKPEKSHNPASQKLTKQSKKPKPNQKENLKTKQKLNKQFKKSSSLSSSEGETLRSPVVNDSNKITRLLSEDELTVGEEPKQKTKLQSKKSTLTEVKKPSSEMSIAEEITKISDKCSSEESALSNNLKPLQALSSSSDSADEEIDKIDYLTPQENVSVKKEKASLKKNKSNKTHLTPNLAEKEFQPGVDDEECMSTIGNEPILSKELKPKELPLLSDTQNEKVKMNTTKTKESLSLSNSEDESKKIELNNQLSLKENISDDDKLSVLQDEQRRIDKFPSFNPTVISTGEIDTDVQKGEENVSNNKLNKSSRRKKKKIVVRECRPKTLTVENNKSTSETKTNQSEKKLETFSEQRGLSDSDEELNKLPTDDSSIIKENADSSTKKSPEKDLMTHSSELVEPMNQNVEDETSLTESKEVEDNPGTDNEILEDSFTMDKDLNDSHADSDCIDISFINSQVSSFYDEIKTALSDDEFLDASDSLDKLEKDITICSLLETKDKKSEEKCLSSLDSLNIDSKPSESQESSAPIITDVFSLSESVCSNLAEHSTSEPKMDKETSKGEKDESDSESICVKHNDNTLNDLSAGTVGKHLTENLSKASHSKIESSLNTSKKSKGLKAKPNSNDIRSLVQTEVEKTPASMLKSEAPCVLDKEIPSKSEESESNNKKFSKKSKKIENKSAIVDPLMVKKVETTDENNILSQSPQPPSVQVNLDEDDNSVVKVEQIKKSSEKSKNKEEMNNKSLRNETSSIKREKYTELLKSDQSRMLEQVGSDFGIKKKSKHSKDKKKKKKERENSDKSNSKKEKKSSHKIKSHGKTNIINESSDSESENNFKLSKKVTKIENKTESQEKERPTEIVDMKNKASENKVAIERTKIITVHLNNSASNIINPLTGKEFVQCSVKLERLVTVNSSGPMEVKKENLNENQIEDSKKNSHLADEELSVSTNELKKTKKVKASHSRSSTSSIDETRLSDVEEPTPKKIKKEKSDCSTENKSVTKSLVNNDDPRNATKPKENSLCKNHLNDEEMLSSDENSSTVEKLKTEEKTECLPSHSEEHTTDTGGILSSSTEVAKDEEISEKREEKDSPLSETEQAKDTESPRQMLKTRELSDEEKENEKPTNVVADVRPCDDADAEPLLTTDTPQEGHSDVDNSETSKDDMSQVDKESTTELSSTAPRTSSESSAQPEKETSEDKPVKSSFESEFSIDDEPIPIKTYVLQNGFSGNRIGKYSGTTVTLKDVTLSAEKDSATGMMLLARTKKPLCFHLKASNQKSLDLATKFIIQLVKEGKEKEETKQKKKEAEEREREKRRERDKVGGGCEAKFPLGDLPKLVRFYVLREGLYKSNRIKEFSGVSVRVEGSRQSGADKRLKPGEGSNDEQTHFMLRGPNQKSIDLAIQMIKKLIKEAEEKDEIRRSLKTEDTASNIKVEKVGADKFEAEYPFDKLPQYMFHFVLKHGLLTGDIKRKSGASITVKGKIGASEKKPQISDGEKPVYFHLSGPSEKSVRMGIQIIEKLIKHAEQEKKATVQPPLSNETIKNLDLLKSHVTIREVGLNKYEAECVVRNIPHSVRGYVLKRGFMKHEIIKQSGAAVFLKESCGSVEAESGNMVLSFEGPSETSIRTGVKMIEDLMKEAVEKEETHVEKVLVGLEETPEQLGVRSLVEGKDKGNLVYIMNKTGSKVTLRGRGSGFLEPFTDSEADEPLHLHIEHKDREQLREAKRRCCLLVKTVQDGCQNWSDTHKKRHQDHQRSENASATPRLANSEESKLSAGISKDTPSSTSNHYFEGMHHRLDVPPSNTITPQSVSFTPPVRVPPPTEGPWSTRGPPPMIGHPLSEGSWAVGGQRPMGGHARTEGSWAVGGRPPMGSHAGTEGSWAVGGRPPMGGHAGTEGSWAVGGRPPMGSHAGTEGPWATGGGPQMGNYLPPMNVPPPNIAHRPITFPPPKIDLETTPSVWNRNIQRPAWPNQLFETGFFDGNSVHNQAAKRPFPAKREDLAIEAKRQRSLEVSEELTTHLAREYDRFLARFDPSIKPPTLNKEPVQKTTFTSAWSDEEETGRDHAVTAPAHVASPDQLEDSVEMVDAFLYQEESSGSEVVEDDKPESQLKNVLKVLKKMLKYQIKSIPKSALKSQLPQVLRLTEYITTEDCDEEGLEQQQKKTLIALKFLEKVLDVHMDSYVLQFVPVLILLKRELGDFDTSLLSHLSHSSKCPSPPKISEGEKGNVAWKNRLEEEEEEQAQEEPQTAGLLNYLEPFCEGNANGQEDFVREEFHGNSNQEERIEEEVNDYNEAMQINRMKRKFSNSYQDEESNVENYKSNDLQDKEEYYKQEKPITMNRMDPKSYSYTVQDVESDEEDGRYNEESYMNISNPNHSGENIESGDEKFRYNEAKSINRMNPKDISSTVHKFNKSTSFAVNDEEDARLRKKVKRMKLEDLGNEEEGFTPKSSVYLDRGTSEDVCNKAQESHSGSESDHEKGNKKSRGMQVNHNLQLLRTELESLMDAETDIFHKIKLAKAVKTLYSDEFMSPNLAEEGDSNLLDMLFSLQRVINLSSTRPSEDLLEHMERLKRLCNPLLSYNFETQEVEDDRNLSPEEMDMSPEIANSPSNNDFRIDPYSSFFKPAPDTEREHTSKSPPIRTEAFKPLEPPALPDLILTAILPPPQVLAVKDCHVPNQLQQSREVTCSKLTSQTSNDRSQQLQHKDQSSTYSKRLQDPRLQKRVPQSQQKSQETTETLTKGTKPVQSKEQLPKDPRIKKLSTLPDLKQTSPSSSSSRNLPLQTSKLTQKTQPFPKPIVETSKLTQKTQPFPKPIVETSRHTQKTEVFPKPIVQPNKQAKTPQPVPKPTVQPSKQAQTTQPVQKPTVQPRKQAQTTQPVPKPAIPQPALLVSQLISELQKVSRLIETQRQGAPSSSKKN